MSQYEKPPGPRAASAQAQVPDYKYGDQWALSDFDFDDIKANLKSFLQGQSQFQDYDFEGSSLSILLDILSYNTHYLAYLANMSTNLGPILLAKLSV